MNASVTWNQGMSFIGTADSGFRINLGADPEVGGENDGFRPLELMVISVAGCTAMDVISILHKKQQPVTAFEVSVQTKRAVNHPKVFTQMLIMYKVTGRNLDETALKRAIELTATKYCPAQAMLGKVAPIELIYQIYEDGAGKVIENKLSL